MNTKGRKKYLSRGYTAPLKQPCRLLPGCHRHTGCFKICFLPGRSSTLEFLVDASYQSSPFSLGGQCSPLALKLCCCRPCVYFTGENTPVEMVACQEGRDVKQHCSPANSGDTPTKGSRVRILCSHPENDAELLVTCGQSRANQAGTSGAVLPGEALCAAASLHLSPDTE